MIGRILKMLGWSPPPPQNLRERELDQARLDVLCELERTDDQVNATRTRALQELGDTLRERTRTPDERAGD